MYHTPETATCRANVGFCGESVFPYFVCVETQSVYISAYWGAKLLGLPTDKIFRLVQQHLHDTTIHTIRYEREKFKNSYYNCLMMHQYRSLLQALASTNPQARVLLNETEDWTNFYGQH